MPTLLNIVNGNNYFTGNRVIGKLLGNNAAIFFSELVDRFDYYEHKQSLVEKEDCHGWFFASTEKITERTNLSRYQQQSCIKKLTLAGILRYHICKLTSQRYFFIDKAGLCSFISKDEERDRYIERTEENSLKDFKGGCKYLTGGGASFSQHNESRSKNLDLKKDIVLPKLANKNKNLPPEKRFALSQTEQESFVWLTGLNLAIDRNTACFWSKKFSIDRLKDVHKEAISRKAKNPGGYMNKLLKQNIRVPTSEAEECAKFAEDFKNANNWVALKIGKKYVTFDFGPTKTEISLMQNPTNFARQLVEKYRLIKKNRY